MKGSNLHGDLDPRPNQGSSSTLLDACGPQTATEKDAERAIKLFFNADWASPPLMMAAVAETKIRGGPTTQTDSRKELGNNWWLMVGS